MDSSSDSAADREMVSIGLRLVDIDHPITSADLRGGRREVSIDKPITSADLRVWTDDDALENEVGVRLVDIDHPLTSADLRDWGVVSIDAPITSAELRRRSC